MDPTSMDPTATGTGPLAGMADATLVEAALAGDRSALGEIYDRYAAPVHTMSRHMLGDPDEAADVCGEVFLVAFQRLGQLRDRDRLKPWLFAIARHEVYRRTAERGRVVLTGEVDTMDTMRTIGPVAAGEPSPELDEHTVDPRQLVQVLSDAATGLDDRDRMVMEMQLQGLDGEELAAALGTSTSTAYQHVHRMKERLGRSLGAVLVARLGREDCEDLDGLLHSWDGQFSVLWRKRVARHVDDCEICDRRRRAVPAALLGGVAAVAPMLGTSAVSAAPASVRDRVMRDARVGTGGSGWSADGFPPGGIPEGEGGEGGEDAEGGEGGEDAERGDAVISERWGRVLALVVLLVVLFVGGAALLWQLLDAGGQELIMASELSEPVVRTTIPPQILRGEEPTIEAPAPALDPGPTTTTTTTVVESAPPVARPSPEPVPQPDPVDPAPIDPPRPSGVRIVVSPKVVFHPSAGFADCGATTEFLVSAPTATAVVLEWTSSGRSGSVKLAQRGADWGGGLEVPADVVGPLQIQAVALAADGSRSVSASEATPVEDCTVPG